MGNGTARTLCRRFSATARAALPPAGLTAVAGLKVGHHTLAARPTGCTVVLAEGGANWWDAFQLIPVSTGFWHAGLQFAVFPVRRHQPEEAAVELEGAGPVRWPIEAAGGEEGGLEAGDAPLPVEVRRVANERRLGRPHQPFAFQGVQVRISGGGQHHRAAQVRLRAGVLPRLQQHARLDAVPCTLELGDLFSQAEQVMPRRCRLSMIRLKSVMRSS